jgi:hypothetical protein
MSKRNCITGSYIEKPKTLKKIIYHPLWLIEMKEAKIKKAFLNKKYYKEHKEEILYKAWRRSLKHAQFLNERFPNSEGHHINEHYIVFIPKELHQKIRHSLRRNKNMVRINKAVFEWVVSERNKELEERLRSIYPEIFIPNRFL